MKHETWNMKHEISDCFCKWVGGLGSAARPPPPPTGAPRRPVGAPRSRLPFLGSRSAPPRRTGKAINKNPAEVREQGKSINENSAGGATWTRVFLSLATVYQAAHDPVSPKLAKKQGNRKKRCKS